eukprot:EG_transcript_19197
MDLALYRTESDDSDDEGDTGLVRYRLELASGHHIFLFSDVRHTLGYCVGNLLCTAALALLKHLQAQSMPWASKRVLELGAGTGAVGLALAKWGAEVVASDVAAMLPLLRRNIARNFDHSAPVQATELVWGAAEVADAPFDVVVGADLLYNPDSVPALVATLWRSCGPQTAVYLSAYHYPEYTGLPDQLLKFFSVEAKEVVRHDGRDSDVFRLAQKEGCAGPVPPQLADADRRAADHAPSDDHPPPKRRRIPEAQRHAIRAAVLACCGGHGAGALHAEPPATSPEPQT